MTFELDEDQAREVAKLRKHASDIRCAIVGAVALKHHVPLPRHTADVDLVIDLDVAELRDLLGGLGWKQHERIEHRWTGPGNFVADALPASSELLKAGKVRLEADTKEMSLAGSDVLFEHAPALPIPGHEQTVQVASLATLVILKVAAWLDRPYERTKDLNDLGCILRSALADDDERRWNGTVPVDPRYHAVRESTHSTHRSNAHFPRPPGARRARTNRGEAGRHQLNASLSRRTALRPGWGLIQQSTNRFVTPLDGTAAGWGLIQSRLLRCSSSSSPDYLPHRDPVRDN